MLQDCGVITGMRETETMQKKENKTSCRWMNHRQRARHEINSALARGALDHLMDFRDDHDLDDGRFPSEIIGVDFSQSRATRRHTLQGHVIFVLGDG